MSRFQNRATERCLSRSRRHQSNRARRRFAGGLSRHVAATFPSGEGSDFAGIVTQVGSGTEGIAVGDEVIGFTGQRASHAEYVVVAGTSVTAKPPRVPWEAAGGVGSIAVQLARSTGATVIGIAGPANHAWRASHGVRPETYGPDLANRLQNTKVDAFIDAHGDGYVELAVKLGISPDRINTIIDFEAARRC
jgi:NADPH:quinone reductase-like Zn-dependent oxidoreductase